MAALPWQAFTHLCEITRSMAMLPYRPIPPAINAREVTHSRGTDHGHLRTRRARFPALEADAARHRRGAGRRTARHPRDPAGGGAADLRADDRRDRRLAGRIATRGGERSRTSDRAADA